MVSPGELYLVNQINPLLPQLVLALNLTRTVFEEAEAGSSLPTMAGSTLRKSPRGFGDLGSGQTGVCGLSTEKNFRSIYFMKWGRVLMMIF